MSNEFPEIDITEYEIKDTVNTLKIVNDSKLIADKKDLENKIIRLLNHKYVGQKTYHVGMTNIKITTTVTNKLILDKFEEFNRLQEWIFNPVTVKIAETFHISSKIIKECEKYGSSMDQKIMREIIQEKQNPSKIELLPAINGGNKCQTLLLY